MKCSEHLLRSGKCINLIFRVAFKIVVRNTVFIDKAGMEAWLCSGELYSLKVVPLNES